MPFVLHECVKDKAKEREHLEMLSRLLCYKLLPAHHDKLTMDLAISVFHKQGTGAISVFHKQGAEASW